MEHKSNTVLILLAIAGVISVSAGVYVIMNPWNLTATQQVIIGICSLVAGVLMAGFPKRSWVGIFGLILFGVYQLGRAGGKIDHAFFRFLVGLPLMGLGFFAIYKVLEVVFPDPKGGNDVK